MGSGELPKVNSKGEHEFGMSHVIPDFVYKAMIKQSPFEIMGDGKQVRTFMHAKDIAEAMSIMIERGIKNDDLNFCGSEGNTISMGELARKVWKVVNGELPFPKVKYLDAPPDDVRYRLGKLDKVSAVLGWKPRYDLDYILNDVSEFIKKNLKR